MHHALHYKQVFFIHTHTLYGHLNMDPSKQKIKIFNFNILTNSRHQINGHVNINVFLHGNSDKLFTLAMLHFIGHQCMLVLLPLSLSLHHPPTPK